MNDAPSNWHVLNTNSPSPQSHSDHLVYKRSAITIRIRPLFNFWNVFHVSPNT
jgi:hypothetical protein